MPKRSRWPLAAGLAAGVALDALLGDPRRGHPVAAFGRAAAALEARDYADSRPRGTAHAAACVLAVAAPAALLHRRTRGRPPSQAAAAALTVWAVTGARSLHNEAERIMAALAANDLPAARPALPSLCGRDPAGLDAEEMARAVIESVAENTCDAVVAPLLWGAVAGLPGLAAYRAVNTLDAMVGYRSPRYLRFGWASARLDDVANWVSGPGHRRAHHRSAPAMVPCRNVRPESPAQGPAHGPAAAAARAVLRDGMPPEPECREVRGRLRGGARPAPGRHERLRRRGRGPPGTGGRAGPGARRHPPRGPAVPGRHRGRDRPGRTYRAYRRRKKPSSHRTSAAMATHHSTCSANPAPNEHQDDEQEQEHEQHFGPPS